MEPLTEPHRKGKFLTLLVNIRQGWDWLSVTNALAYSAAVGITVVKIFIVLLHRGIENEKLKKKLNEPS